MPIRRMTTGENPSTREGKKLNLRWEGEQGNELLGVSDDYLNFQLNKMISQFANQATWGAHKA